MTDSVLKAQLQLFAIVVKLSGLNEETAEQKLENYLPEIRNFLASEVPENEIDNYTELFISAFHLIGKKKKIDSIDPTTNNTQGSVNVIKILRVCKELNKELNTRQKYHIFIRINELIPKGEIISEEMTSFLETLATSFHLQQDEAHFIQHFVHEDATSMKDLTNVLIVQGEKTRSKKTLFVQGLQDEVMVGFIPSLNIIIVRYLGEDNFSINGNSFDASKTYILHSGSYIQCGPSNRIYQSDLLNRFLHQSHKEHFVFKVDNVSYNSKENTIVHPITTAFKSGRLVGILGSSGSGKTTLINLLNGSLRPSTGNVTINDVNLHDHPNQFEGIIGYVPQDDQLIEHLTVYENLYFTAKLCFNQASKGEIQLKVHRILHTFGLDDVKNIKVGNALTKTISGGQRKRLNIALELIQNPNILFIDEPTSGLNSKGSLSIMNHLKELTFSGKLVFVVIHQPSSEIFKLFNRVLLLDQGGYLAFDGKPFEALSYFNQKANQVGKVADECPSCLNVKPEKLFEIIDAKALDNNGRTSEKRKISPKEWNDKYLAFQKKTKYTLPKIKPLEPHIKKPSNLEQFITFFNRDAVGKIKNLQFIIIMLLQAPILALLLSIFIKDYGDDDSQYFFYNNANIPSFFFVSVLVAIFFGMTMSAEEIFKDLKTLKRQRFMHLSWNSYLLSKMGVLSIISLIQSLLYTYVSSIIIELNHSFWAFWWMFFSLNIWANTLGLIFSSLFRSTKVIYIVVTLFIIPQIIFSGMLNRFDKMHPVFRTDMEVPWIGNIMASRWANEALFVEIASENPLEKELFHYKSHISQSIWKLDYWIPAIRQVIEGKTDIQLVKNEFEKEAAIWPKIKCVDCFNGNRLNEVQAIKYIDHLQQAYKYSYNKWNKRLEQRIRQYGEHNYRRDNLLNNNEAVMDLTSNKYQFNKILIDFKEHKLLQMSDPIYQIPDTRFLNAPLYSKIKRVFRMWYMDTYWTNTIVLWFFTFLMYLLLAFQIPTKFCKFVNDRK